MENKTLLEKFLSYFTPFEDGAVLKKRFEDLFAERVAELDKIKQYIDFDRVLAEKLIGAVLIRKLRHVGNLNFTKYMRKTFYLCGIHDDEEFYDTLNGLLENKILSPSSQAAFDAMTLASAKSLCRRLTAPHFDRSIQSGWLNARIATTIQKQDLIHPLTLANNKNLFVTINNNYISGDSGDVKRFRVVAKCGHVGKDSYIKGEFVVLASNKKEASRLAKTFPRVKRNHKDCILSVEEISSSEFSELFVKHMSDSYMRFSSKRQQKEKFSSIKDRIIKEEKKSCVKKNKQQNKINRKDSKGKTIRDQKKYSKNNQSFDNLDFDDENY